MAVTQAPRDLGMNQTVLRSWVKAYGTKVREAELAVSHGENVHRGARVVSGAKRVARMSGKPSGLCKSCTPPAPFRVV